MSNVFYAYTNEQDLNYFLSRLALLTHKTQGVKLYGSILNDLTYHGLFLTQKRLKRESIDKCCRHNNILPVVLHVSLENNEETTCIIVDSDFSIRKGTIKEAAQDSVGIIIPTFILFSNVIKIQPVHRSLNRLQFSNIYLSEAIVDNDIFKTGSYELSLERFPIEKIEPVLKNFNPMNFTSFDKIRAGLIAFFRGTEFYTSNMDSNITLSIYDLVKKSKEKSFTQFIKDHHSNIKSFNKELGCEDDRIITPKLFKDLKSLFSKDVGPVRKSDNKALVLDPWRSAMISAYEMNFNECREKEKNVKACFLDNFKQQFGSISRATQNSIDKIENLLSREPKKLINQLRKTDDKKVFEKLFVYVIINVFYHNIQNDFSDMRKNLEIFENTVVEKRLVYLLYGLLHGSYGLDKEVKSDPLIIRFSEAKIIEWVEFDKNVLAPLSFETIKKAHNKQVHNRTKKDFPIYFQDMESIVKVVDNYIIEHWNENSILSDYTNQLKTGTSVAKKLLSRESIVKIAKKINKSNHNVNQTKHSDNPDKTAQQTLFDGGSNK